MHRCHICPAGKSEALDFACRHLRRCGYSLQSAPNEDTDILLLPAPAFTPDGYIKGGVCLEEILKSVPSKVTVAGGKLDNPVLKGYEIYDLLEDPFYLAENAAITAHCTVKIILNNLPCIIAGCPVLIIGWGRIGKCLAQLLRNLGAKVTVAARKPADRGMLAALGYQALPTEELDTYGYRVVINTVPYEVCAVSDSSLNIDLASKKGISGANVLWARGLPNLEAPESSGALIARSLCNLIYEKEQTL